MAKVQLEMGGKNPLIVLDDADLPTAIECAINGAYFSTGQRCTASSRLIVTEGIHDKFVSAVRQRLVNLKVDHALKAGTDIGPVVDQRQLQKNLDYVQVGIQEGAHLVCGGEHVARDTEGFFMTPALFTETNNNMRINREEIFGPVASVVRVKDYEQALATANDTEFGLAAYFYSQNIKQIYRVSEGLEFGMVGVNEGVISNPVAPFGGVKQSGLGREGGHQGLNEYLEEKYVCIKI